jgi:uncharacterized low-complexity protein
MDKENNDMLNKRLKPITLAVGAAFAVSAAAVAAADSLDTPFAATDLGAGYDTLAHKHDAEGKCGEGKCGEGRCGEGKCGEGKCGEGKCGDSA